MIEDGLDSRLDALGDIWGGRVLGRREDLAV